MLRGRGFSTRAIFITEIVFLNKVQMRAGAITFFGEKASPQLFPIHDVDF